MKLIYPEKFNVHGTFIFIDKHYFIGDVTSALYFYRNKKDRKALRPYKVLEPPGITPDLKSKIDPPYYKT
jgi:hypothetical protein